MEIIKKEVKFNSDKVLAVMKDGKLYVGVSNICNNLKMSKKMKDRQVANIQSDLVLSKGCLKFGAGVFDLYNQAFAIELDYLPLWLAKIRITPNMVDEKKELVRKLVEYQLHAKDVLAAAFLDKPKQLTLSKPKEHKIIKKYYNGVPVMSVMDLATITGKDRTRVLYYAPKNKTMIHKYEMTKFKEENPNLPNALVHMSILYREEVINICKSLKVYNFVKPQILAYFDGFTPEPNIVSSEPREVATDQNMKAEKLLQLLPNITDGDLKNKIAIEVIRLIDNKILEEYENGRLSMRFIDSTEKIIEVRERAGYRISVVETDKPIVECRQAGLTISNVLGNKMIVEKIK